MLNGRTGWKHVVILYFLEDIVLLRSHPRYRWQNVLQRNINERIDFNPRLAFVLRFNFVLLTFFLSFLQVMMAFYAGTSLFLRMIKVKFVCLTMVCTTRTNHSSGRVKLALEMRISLNIHDMHKSIEKDL